MQFPGNTNLPQLSEIIHNSTKELLQRGILERTEKVDLDPEVLRQLRTCNSVAAIDQLTVHFSRINDIGVWKSLAEELIQVPDENAIPFYSRMLASLAPHSLDLTSMVLDGLQKRFTELVEDDDEDLREKKKFALYIGQLGQSKTATRAFILACFEVLEKNYHLNNEEAFDWLKSRCWNLGPSSSDIEARIREICIRVDKAKQNKKERAIPLVDLEDRKPEQEIEEANKKNKSAKNAKKYAKKKEKKAAERAAEEAVRTAWKTAVDRRRVAVEEVEAARRDATDMRRLMYVLVQQEQLRREREILQVQQNKVAEAEWQVTELQLLIRLPLSIKDARVHRLLERRVELHQERVLLQGREKDSAVVEKALIEHEKLLRDFLMSMTNLTSLVNRMADERETVTMDYLKLAQNKRRFVEKAEKFKEKGARLGAYHAWRSRLHDQYVSLQDQENKNAEVERMLTGQRALLLRFLTEQELLLYDLYLLGQSVKDNQLPASDTSN